MRCKIATGWQCPEHSSNWPCPVGTGAPARLGAGLGTRRQRNPHPAHESMARMTCPGPSPPSLWGHPGLNEGSVVEAACPCPAGLEHPACQQGGHCGLCMVLLPISVTATVPGMPAPGREQDQECSVGMWCQGHSCCWHFSGLPGGRSNTAPGWLLLPTG